MFGILFFVFVALCGGLYAIRNGINDVKIYKDTKDDFNCHYIDSLGRKREIGTGNLVAILSDDYGDDIMYTPKGKVVKNITEIKRHKFIDAIQTFKSDLTVYWCDLREYHENEWSEIQGPRYMDKDTGEVYIVRKFDVDGLVYRKRNNVAELMENHVKKESIDFYMSIDDGHLIRPTDSCLSRNKQLEYLTEKDYLTKNKDVIQSFIDTFNQKQDIDIKNRGVDGFDDHFYFNSNSSYDFLADEQWHIFCKNQGKLELAKEKTETTWSH